MSFLGLIVASHCFSDTIEIRADEWCPYNCSPKSDEKGFVVELAENIFKKAGHNIVYTTLNWSRAVRDCRNGSFAGIIGANKDEVPDFIFPDEEQGVSGEEFVIKKGKKWRYDGVDSLEKILLGAVQDYGYGEPIHSYVVKHSEERKRITLLAGEDTIDRALKMLVKDRIDVYVDSSWVLKNFLLKNKDIRNEVEFAGTNRPVNIYIAFSPNNPKSKEYAQILSNGMTELRANGELQVLLDHYGLTDWKSPTSSE